MRHDQVYQSREEVVAICLHWLCQLNMTLPLVVLCKWDPIFMFSLDALLHDTEV